MATCDSLRVEYLEASDRRASLGDLPRRRLAHEAAGQDPLRAGRGRARRGGGFGGGDRPPGSSRALLLGRRSRRLAADPGLWHVTPSGMLERGAAGDRPLVPTVATELREELGVVLSGPDELAARLRVLGIGYDLLSLRPDVCLRLDLELGEPVAETPRRSTVSSPRSRSSSCRPPGWRTWERAALRARSLRPQPPRSPSSRARRSRAAQVRE